MTTSREPVRLALRKLWSDHVIWTRGYIIAAAAGTPDADAAAGRLLANQEDIGAAVAGFYGKDAGDRLTELLKEHILIAVDLVAAAKSGDQPAFATHGLSERVDELNRTAAILARAEVNAAGGTALVAGDIGPSGEIVQPLGTLDYDIAVDVFREQAASLAAGGVDLIWIETMSDLNEMKAAIEGVRRVAPGIALVTTMTFDTRGYTMMGVSPEQAVEALVAWGADAVGGNCGNGPDELVPVIEKMRTVDPDAVLVAKSNAGMRELVDMKARRAWMRDQASG